MFPRSLELPSDLDDSESLVPGDVFGVLDSSAWPRVPLLTEFVESLPGSSKLIWDALKLGPTLWDTCGAWLDRAVPSFPVELLSNVSATRFSRDGFWDRDRILNFVFRFCGRSIWLVVGDVVIIFGARVEILVSIIFQEGSELISAYGEVQEELEVVSIQYRSLTIAGLRHDGTSLS